jgi:hypothetical protein
MRKLLLGAILLSAVTGVWAQGITTAAISGLIKDSKGEFLPGATVILLHQSSGTRYGTSSRNDGNYTIPNARVGGPYKVTVSFIGYQQQERDNVFLSLGNTTEVNFTLVEEGTQLEEVKVVASRGDLISQERTGAATNISNAIIQSMPNISRGLKDFTKLSPLANTAGNGTSFAGASNRYNQFAIDGLITNDVFGLTNSGTNGGQANIEPISLDAIEEFQINIAPYDVRQGGFTGGGINAVTRSGSNTFQGSVYYYGNNQTMVGKTNPNTGEKKTYPDYKDYQMGVRLGGPILKNKLFFFVSGEITAKKTPVAFLPGTSASGITTDEINSVVNTLKTIAPNYDPGAWSSISNETNSKKLLAKIDWNISNQHKLTLRHSYTFGEDISNGSTNTAFRFYNNGIYFPSTTNSTALELNSNFSTKLSNRLLLGYTRVRDNRDPLGSPFPYTVINLGPPTGRTITFGSENSSVANQLDQNIFSLTDDVTFFAGKHIITVGTNNELYKFYNLFVQNIYGSYAFKTLADFESQTTGAPTAPTFYQIGYSFDGSDNPLQTKGGAKFKAMQLGLYVQDEWQINTNFKVNLGIRGDLPVFPDKPTANDAFNTTYAQYGGTGVVPKSRVLWSPRVGFNWDALGDKTLQVRGASGIFTGRVPFVWVSNQFSNNGQLVGTYSTGSASPSANPLTNGIVYSTDPNNQPTAEALGATAGKGDINVIDKNFKFPQVFRTNLAVDKQLPWGLVATAEVIYSKTFNNINFTNINRKVDNTFTYDGVDKRPRYVAGRTDPTYNEIVKTENTNKGYTFNYVLQVQKKFEKGFTASLAYSYGDSRDLNSGSSSVAYSNWRFVNNIYGPNNLSVTRSNYSAGSRVIGFVSYRKEYFNGLASTQISLFYNGQSGQPISYIYNGDMNNDGTTNDMIFVPEKASDINLVSYTKKDAQGNIITVTPEEQWTSLEAFINGDDYLKSRKGKYAERNGARLPFQNQFDLRILQEFAVKVGNSKNKIQISLDVINIGNLFNSDWGKKYSLLNQQYSLVNYTGVTASQPNFTYNPTLINGAPWSAIDLNSRWRMQIGLRYLFN